MKGKPWLTDPRAYPAPSLPQVVAIKAVAQGSATEEQQKRFMAWLINDACGYGPPRAYFGEDAAFKSYFAMGRQRVAEIIRNFVEKPIEQFKDGKPSEQVT